MSFLIVTCLFDIAGFENNKDRRQIDDYLILFEWLRSSPFELVLYTDVPERIKPRDKLHIVSRRIPSLKYYPKISGNLEVTANINNSKDTLNYYSVINSKIDLICDASEQYPNYDYYVWIDSGYPHVAVIPYNELEKGLKHNMIGKIIMPLIKYCPTPNILEQGPDIAGGLMIIPKSELVWLSTVFDDKSNLFLRDNICRHEEVSLSLVAYDHPDKFEFVYGVYRYMYNLMYITENPVAVIDWCLTRARQGDNHKLVVSITKKLLFTFSNKFIHFPEHTKMLADVLYHGFISSYYVDKKLMKDLALLIHYVYLYLPHVPLRGEYSNIVDNVKFAGVDINTSFHKANILNSPYVGCVWSWMDAK